MSTAAKPLPSSQQMASAVSRVTQTMLGLTFVPDQGKRPDAGDALVWRTALLPIEGQRPLTVGLSSDQHGCARLSAAMYSCPSDHVDDAMMNDSLRELVNMTAGLLKSVMAINQALGLPRIIVGSESPTVPAASPHVIRLKADSLGLLLWIYEGVA